MVNCDKHLWLHEEYFYEDDDTEGTLSASCMDQIGQSKHYAKANKHLKVNTIFGQWTAKPNSSRALSNPVLQ